MLRTIHPRKRPTTLATIEMQSRRWRGTPDEARAGTRRSRIVVVVASVVLGACGAVAPEPDAGDVQDATTDVVEAAAVDATLDTSFDAGLPDTSEDVLDEPDATPDAGNTDGAVDADADVYFNAIPDASGCTYYSDASCTTIPKPTSIEAGCVVSPPVLDGGTIVPGVYHLTHVDWNEQFFDGGCPAKTTHGGNLEICGNIIQDYDVNEVQSVFVGNLVYQTVGNQLELNQYCPSGPYFASFEYSATSTEIIINWGIPVALIETFTKQ